MLFLTGNQLCMHGFLTFSVMSVSDESAWISVTYEFRFSLSQMLSFRLLWFLTKQFQKQQENSIATKISLEFFSQFWVESFDSSKRKQPLATRHASMLLNSILMTSMMMTLVIDTCRDLFRWSCGKWASDSIAIIASI